MNSYLETAIAVVFVIITFSIIAYVIQELIAANLQFRGKMLWNSLKLLLDGRSGSTANIDRIYNHPQIEKLKELSDKLPSYVPSANFALAVIDEVAKVAPGGATDDLFADFKKGLTAFSAANGDVKTLLENYAKTSGDIKELQANIEKWFNEYMDRVSGWYKKNTVKTMRIIAVCVALGFNVDMIAITKAIDSNSGLKASLVASAEKMVDNNPNFVKDKLDDNITSRLAAVDKAHEAELKSKTTAKDSAEVMQAIGKEKDAIINSYTQTRVNEIDTLVKSIDAKQELPIGWNRSSYHKTLDELKEWSYDFWLKLFGWLLGAIAISLGAPFWFDLLMKLVNLRRSGIKPNDPKSNNNNQSQKS